MSDLPAVLDARLVRRVHAGLTVDVSLRLGAEIGVLFGPSGSGKTTILRLITGLSRPDAGSVRLGDSVLFDAASGVNLPLRQRRIGMIFQDDLLFPHLRVAQNIGFGIKEKTRRERQTRLEETAILCGVEHLLSRWPETLSGGERQRVGLARALAPRPRLLLCDEPVSALDLPNRQSLLVQLKAVQRALGIPVLYVTHSPAEAVTLGTRLFLLERGKVASEGPPLQILTRARGLSAGHFRLDEMRNVLPARVQEHRDDSRTTRLSIDDGPLLIVPFLDHPAGTPVVVEVRAEDVLLASGPISGLSAQNVIGGQVEKVMPHGAEAEVLIRTGGITWISSVVAPALEQLSLHEGQPVHMIIKARSCHVRQA
ncbi:MAG: molybdenum ABC transporter ATP-binding protein [Planctomycetaceae bacterium]|nr:molybdenum ABC transporter ATP-binding protein [Planctomycetaceae bacterium]